MVAEGPGVRAGQWPPSINTMETDICPRPPHAASLLSLLLLFLLLLLLVLVLVLLLLLLLRRRRLLLLSLSFISRPGGHPRGGDARPAPFPPRLPPRHPLRPLQGRRRPVRSRPGPARPKTRFLRFYSFPSSVSFITREPFRRLSGRRRLRDCS